MTKSNISSQIDALLDSVKKMDNAIRNWKLALNRFMIEFDDRLKDYLYDVCCKNRITKHGIK